MFNNKRELKKIAEEKRELETLRKEIERQKQELLKIKEILDSNSTKIDITDVYMLTLNNVKYFVRINSKKIIAYSPFFEKNIPANNIQLYDIFSNNCILEKTSLDSIDEMLKNIDLQRIWEAKKELLIYVDKMVPDYILHQLFCKLNNLNLSSQTLIRK